MSWETPAKDEYKSLFYSYGSQICKWCKWQNCFLARRGGAHQNSTRNSKRDRDREWVKAVIRVRVSIVPMGRISIQLHMTRRRSTRIRWDFLSPPLPWLTTPILKILMLSVALFNHHMTLSSRHYHTTQCWRGSKRPSQVNSSRSPASALSIKKTSWRIPMMALSALLGSCLVSFSHVSIPRKKAQ